MKTLTKLTLFAACCVVLVEPSLAVDPSAAGAAAQGKVSQIINIFLQIIVGIGAALFTAMISMAGYKMGFVEGTKLADLKGILIGGVLFGTAAAIAAIFVS